MDLNTVEAIVPADRGAVDRLRAGDAWLAGGTWLFSEPQPEVRRLIDLTALRWPALSAGERGLEIAATCTLADLAEWAQASRSGPGSPGREGAGSPGREGAGSPGQEGADSPGREGADSPGPEGTDSPGRAVTQRWPACALIGQCCRALLGSFKVWNAATVGGNLCLALPAGPMTSLAVALDGVCTVWEPGGQVAAVPARDFVLGPGQTALRPGALLRSVMLPAAALRAQTAFRQLSLSPLGRSAVLVIGRRSPAGDEVVITLTASVPRPVQLRFGATPSALEVREALDDAVSEYYDDPHGHPAWREHLSRMYAEEVRGELEAIAVPDDAGVTRVNERPG